MTGLSTTRPMIAPHGTISETRARSAGCEEVSNGLEVW
jgi:hypothetical protein